MKYVVHHEVALPRTCKALALSPDDATLALTFMDKKLRLYDAATRMAVSRDGSRLFLGDAGLGAGAGLVVVDLAPGAVVAKNDEVPSLPVGVAASSDGRSVYLADASLHALREHAGRAG